MVQIIVFVKDLVVVVRVFTNYNPLSISKSDITYFHNKYLQKVILSIFSLKNDRKVLKPFGNKDFQMIQLKL